MRLETVIRGLKRYLRDIDRAIETFEAAAERELAQKCNGKEPAPVDYGPMLVWDASQRNPVGGLAAVLRDAMAHPESDLAA